jgi:hypothetical protein
LKTSFIYWLFLKGWIFIILFFAGFTVYCWVYPYEIVAPQILKFYEWWNDYPNFPFGLMPEGRFILLRYFLLTISIVLIISTLRINKIYIFLSYHLIKLFQSCREWFFKLLTEINTLTFWQKIYILGSFFLVSLPKVYLAICYPVFVDEAFSYATCISYGLVVTTTYYFLPNNHIFYNVLVVLLDYLIPFKFDEPIILMRLISLLAFMISWLILILWLRKIFNFSIALWGSVVWAFLPPVAYYGFIGRGYGLQVLFILIFNILVFNTLNKPTNYSQNRYLLILIAILGFYTIPSFLYPFASLWLVLLIQVFTKHQGFKSFRLLIYDVFFIVIASLTLYSLTFLMSGPRLWVNMDLIPLSWQDIGQRLNKLPTEILVYFIGFDSLLIQVISIFLMIAFLFNSFFRLRSSSFLNLIILSFWLTPIPIFIFLQKTVPPIRVLTYLSLPILLMILVLLNNIGQKKQWIVGLLFIWSFFNIYLFFNQYKLSYQYDDYAKVAQVINQKPHKSVQIIVDNNYEWFLKYEIRKHQQPIHYRTQVSAPNELYDFLIISYNQNFPKSLRPEKYRLLLSNQQIKLFELLEKE